MNSVFVGLETAQDRGIRGMDIVYAASGQLMLSGECILTGSEAAAVEKNATARLADGWSVIRILMSELGAVRQARMSADVAYERGAYDIQERRVADWLSSAGVGGGVDPIGFLMASAALSRHQAAARCARIKQLEAQLRELGVEPAPALSTMPE